MKKQHLSTKTLNEQIKQSRSELSQHENKNLLKIYDDIVGNFMYKINTLNAEEIKTLSNNISQTINGIANSIFINRSGRIKTIARQKTYWHERLSKKDLNRYYPYDNQTEKNMQVYKKNLKTGFSFIDNNYLYNVLNRSSSSNNKIKDQEQIELLKKDSTSVLKDLKTTTQIICNNIADVMKEINKRKICIIKTDYGAEANQVVLKKDGKFFVKGNNTALLNKQITEEELKKKMQEWIEKSHYKIIVEDCVVNPEKTHEFIPYKFLCGCGDVFCGRRSYKTSKIKGFEKFNEYLYLDENQNQLSYQIDKITPEQQQAIQPDTLKDNKDHIMCDKETYKKMWNMAQELSKTFPNQRIDFLVTKKDGKYEIYFNEIQNNDTATLSFMISHLTNEGLMKYNEMVNFANVPEEKLPDILKMVHKQEKKMERKIDRSNLTIAGKPKTKVKNKIKNKSPILIDKNKTNIQINNTKTTTNEKRSKENIIKKTEAKNQIESNAHSILSDEKKTSIIKNNAKTTKNKNNSKDNNIKLPNIYNNKNVNLADNNSNKFEIKNKEGDTKKTINTTQQKQPNKPINYSKILKDSLKDFSTSILTSLQQIYGQQETQQLIYGQQNKKPNNKKNPLYLDNNKKNNKKLKT